MAKLMHRYVQFLTFTLLLSGISLLLWLHEDRWRSLKVRMRPNKSSQLLYAEKLKEMIDRRTSKPEFEEEDIENGRYPHLNNKRPKVYIYSLPPKFTTDIFNCLNKGPGISCFNLINNGFGTLLYKEGEMEVYNTNQFSLEIIMHYQLWNSEYLTDNPAEAEVFYIPNYLGAMFFCKEMRGKIKEMHEELFQEVNKLPYFQSGKPHVSALAKIEREMSTTNYPLLRNPHSRNVTYITIEKEARRSWQRIYGISDQRVIVAPYPSYVHRNDFSAESQEISSPPVDSRNVFLFLAASTRRSNLFRALLLDQFETKVQGESYTEFLKKGNTHEIPSQVMLVTPECYPNHINITINWMQHSVFCLQPHGDSPTRKSFFDCIQGGCIPVIFSFPREDVEHPFQSVLNYTDFTVTIESSKIEKENMTVIDILKKIPESRVNLMHNNVLQVARQLQYSKQDRSKPKKYIDALDMIMDQVRKIHHL